MRISSPRQVKVFLPNATDFEHIAADFLFRMNGMAHADDALIVAASSLA
jgi:hypothetical protein